MYLNAEHVEIYSGVQRRRRCSVDEKLRIVQEAIWVDEEVGGFAEVNVLEKRIRQLERVLVKKTLENEYLREAVKVAHEKN